MTQSSIVLVLGVFVADAAFRADRMPVPGETLIGTGFQLGPGGKGSNQAVAAARAGAETALLTRVGRDGFAEMGRAIWAEAGVMSLAIKDADRPTGAAGIFIEESSGQNAIIIAPGAAGALSVADVEAHKAEIETSGIAMTQLEQPMETAFRFLQMAKAAGVTTILNPAPAADLPDGMLALCDYVTPNEEEAHALTGVKVDDEDSARAAAEALLDQGVSKAVILTLGAAGALVHDGTVARLIPPLNAGPVRDTTGAGDAFNGGFAAALAEGASLEDALSFATATAALCVTKDGTAASMPTRAEIDGLLR